MGGNYAGWRSRGPCDFAACNKREGSELAALDQTLRAITESFLIYCKKSKKAFFFSLRDLH